MKCTIFQHPRTRIKLTIKSHDNHGNNKSFWLCPAGVTRANWFACWFCPFLFNQMPSLTLTLAYTLACRTSIKKTLKRAPHWGCISGLSQLRIDLRTPRLKASTEDRWVDNLRGSVDSVLWEEHYFQHVDSLSWNSNRQPVHRWKSLQTLPTELQ